MANVFCNDDGDNSDGSTWAKAYTTLQAAITAAGAGGSVWLGDTHAESYNAANQTLTCPADASPVRIVSCDVAQATATFKAPAAAQYTTVGNYDILFDGSLCAYGVWFSVGDDWSFSGVDPESQQFHACKFTYAAASSCLSAGTDFELLFKDCTFILGDTGATNTPLLRGPTAGLLSVINPTFSGTLTHRNDELFGAHSSGRTSLVLVGGDYSGFTSLARLYARVATTPHMVIVDGVKVASGVVITDAVGSTALYGDYVTRHNANNYGIQHTTVTGQTTDGDITRDSGASDGDRHSWKVVTTARCRAADPYYTPWMPVWVATTGSKTFTVYIGNASADLTDTECWLEVEYLGTASSTVPTYATDRNANILAAGTAQTDDTASDWDADLTYMQSLAVASLTVAKAGLQRCRVGFAKASATVYVDPMVTVS